MLDGKTLICRRARLFQVESFQKSRLESESIAVCARAHSASPYHYSCLDCMPSPSCRSLSQSENSCSCRRTHSASEQAMAEFDSGRSGDLVDDQACSEKEPQNEGSARAKLQNPTAADGMSHLRRPRGSCTTVCLPS